MADWITLREYERLDATDRRLTGEEFDALEEFVLDYQSRHKKGVLEIAYSGGVKYFKPTHYVGLITLPDGKRIEILPKLALAAHEEQSEEEQNQQTREFFFTMLCACGVIPRAPSSHSSLDHRHVDMLECFYAAFVEAAQKLVRQGLASGYHPYTGNEPFLKGRLELAGHIRYNAAHQERFYVTYDVFDQDREENRLIKTALVRLERRTASMVLRGQIHHLLEEMEGISLSVDPAAEFGRLAKDRSVSRYREALEWVRLFLLHESFTTFSGENGTRAALFPMERVFQDYVALQLRQELTGEGWTVTTQDRGYYLFHDGNRGWFRLQPDILLTHGRRADKQVFVMDTKWKRLDSKARSAGFSQADFYQMYAYGKKYRARRVVVLYPRPDDEETFRKLNGMTFNSADAQDPVTAEVRLLRTDRIKEELVPYVRELLI